MNFKLIVTATGPDSRTALENLRTDFHFLSYAILAALEDNRVSHVGHTDVTFEVELSLS